MEKVKTNRKTTRGRKIYYQDIFDKDEKRIKTIKHIQASSIKLKYAEKNIEILNYRSQHTESCNPKTIKKRNFKNRGILIWDSQKKGAFIGSIKDTFLNN